MFINDMAIQDNSNALIRLLVAVLRVACSKGPSIDYIIKVLGRGG